MMSKYSVKSTMEMPTTLTVTTRHRASLTLFHTKDGMEPEKKKRMTAKGSAWPLASLTEKTEVSVLKQGTTMNPRNRYPNSTAPKTFHSFSSGSPFFRPMVFCMRSPPYCAG